MKLKKLLAMSAITMSLASGLVVVGTVQAQAVNVCVPKKVLVAKKYTTAQAFVYCQPFFNYNKPARCYGNVYKTVITCSK